MRILNASPGFGAPLTESEVINFLTNSKLNIHIGTLDKKGEPNIHPTWYYFDTTDNRFYIETSKQSRKTENLDRNNIIYYCVDDPNPPYKGVPDWKMESGNIMKTDLKSNIGIAKMGLDQVVRVLNKQLVNDYYLLFTKALHSRLRSCSTSLLGANLYD